MAQDPLGRPFGELDLADELGPYEDRAARGLGRAPEGGRLAPEGLEALRQVLEVAVREAASNPAAVAQGAAGVVVAHEEGPDARLALALAGHPAADHELLAALVLHLRPGTAAAARLVDGVESLGDHALEPLLGARLEQGAPLARVGARGSPRGPLEPELLQPRAALLVGEPHQRVAVQVEEVEDHVGGGDLPGPPLDAAISHQMHAVLEPLEARAAALVERHDLAVEHRRA